MITRILLAACLLANLGLAVCPPVQAGATSSFQTGWGEFHRLRKNESKAKYRSAWMQVKKYFQRALEQDPHGKVAPKSLYYLGRTYQELGKRSFLDKDFDTALHYFEQVVERYPSHSWSDDAKLYQAKIHLNHLKEPDQAYLDLLHIVHNYPDGDMLPKAKTMLNQLDKRFMEQVGMNLDVDPSALRKSRQEAAQQASSSEKPSSSETESKPACAGLNRLQDIRHWSSDEYTRVVLDLEENCPYKDFLLKPDPKLNTPYRLVVDLKNTSVNPDLEESVTIEDGILEQVRTGQNRKTKARVVLDIRNLDNYRAFTLDNPFRVVLDVYAPEKGRKQQLAKHEQKGSATISDKSKSLSGSLVEQLGLDIQTVMIDPGHGGKDPGAVFGDIYEKDINLRLAKILGKILEEQGYEVLYTRTTDTFLPLEERTAIANSKKADLFISLHVNAHKNRNVDGFEIYYLNLAQSKDAVRVAARENAVSTKKISDLQVILTDLMLNSKIQESQNLAETVLDKTLSYGRQFYSIDDHGVRQAPFYVLMGAKMPSVLVELGYLTNSDERKKLQSYAYLKRLAYGIAQGISTYRKEIQNYASLNGPGSDSSNQ
jgi:N-acetylmuramoyl-L-alanine amidase